MNEIKQKKLKFFFLILCVIQLLYLLHYRSGFKFEILKNPFSEKSGINYSLSSEIVEFKELLINHKLSNYNLSKGIKENTYLYQRSIEFSYPIRFNNNAKATFFLANEKLTSGCQEIENSKYLKLAKCSYD